MHRPMPLSRLRVLVIAACAVVVTAAQAQTTSSVTLYGLVDAGIEASRSGKGTFKRLYSGGYQGSRWGVRGIEDLGGGWNAQFRLESGFNIDDGTFGQGGRAFGREAWVGVGSTGAGLVQLGRVYAPYWYAQSVVDAFAWSTGGGMLAITRSSGATLQVLPQAVNARTDNSLNYVTPKMGGVEVRAQVAAGEGSTAIGRTYGLSGRYAGGALDLAAGYALQRGRDNTNGDIKSWSIGGSWDLRAVKVFAGVTQESNACTTCTGTLMRTPGIAAGGASEFRLINLGTRVPIFGAATAVAQIVRVQDRSDYAANPGSRDANWLSVGGEYALSKRSIVYGSVSSTGNRNGSAYAIGTGTAQQPASSVAAGNPRATTLSLGMRHAF